MSDNAKQLRSFIGTKFKDNDLAQLLEWQNLLKQQIDMPQISWIREKNIHMTFDFLGEIDNSVANHLNKQLQEILQQTPKVTIELDNLAPFPNRRRAIVLAAVFKTNDTLTQLIDNIKALTADYRTTTEKHPFKPHVTLAYLQPRGKFDNQIIFESQQTRLTINSIDIYICKPEIIDDKYQPLTQIELQ